MAPQSSPYISSLCKTVSSLITPEGVVILLMGNLTDSRIPTRLIIFTEFTPGRERTIVVYTALYLLPQKLSGNSAPVRLLLYPVPLFWRRL
jgi:hypothetical protein